jgi:hypothetical protein
MSEPTPITAGRSEAQVAKEYRERALAQLEALADLLTEAKRDHGLTVTFQLSGADSFGRTSIAMLEISKKLC